MKDRAKWKMLAFLLLTVLATILIAAALAQLELAPGIPLPNHPERPAALPSGDMAGVSISIDTFLKAILESILVLVLVLAYCAYKVIRGVPWKEIFRPAFFIGAVTVVAMCILFSLMKVHIEFKTPMPETLPPAVKIPDPLLRPMPPGLIWLVWAGLAAGIVFLAIWLIQHPARQTRPGDPLEAEALKALRDLKSGSDLKNVIVRCYVQMSQVLRKEQGFELEESMTAREFEDLLEARGVPHEPVNQLTQLFEAARYGHLPPGLGDEQKAFASLNAIVQYSRARPVPEQNEN